MGVKEMWELYKSVRGRKLKIFPVLSKNPIELYQLRELCTFPPIYFILVDEIFGNNVKLYKALVLTEEIELGWLSSETPIVRLPHLRTVLVVLPFWVYLDEEFLFNYTSKLGVLNSDDICCLESYAERVQIPDAYNICGKYIRFLMRLLAFLNTNSIFAYLDSLEE